MIYCIDCEMTLTKVLQHQVDFNGYHLTEYSVHLDEWFTCDGPFTYSAPPEIEDGWNDNLVEPDADELEQMDMAAESLRLEFV